MVITIKSIRKLSEATAMYSTSMITSLSLMIRQVCWLPKIGILYCTSSPYFPENGSFIEKLDKLIATGLDKKRKNYLYIHEGINGALSQSNEKNCRPMSLGFLIRSLSDITITAVSLTEPISNTSAPAANIILARTKKRAIPLSIRTVVTTLSRTRPTPVIW